MCDCIKQTEEKFKEHLKNNDSTFKDIDDFEVNFINKAYLFGNGKTVLTIPIEAEWQHKAKSGRISTKRKTQRYMMDYCPFCGEKQSKESDN